jgi:flagellin
MSTVINTNMASLYAQNNLSNAQNNLATSVQRLSSGLRINSAKDDAAGLAISQNMKNQINAVNQSVRNLNDATNLLAVADTALGTIQDMILRMKQLATQGGDGALSSAQRKNLVDELTQLNTEINNTATRAKFNGNPLISATQELSTASSIVNSATFGGTQISEVAVNGATTGTFSATYDTGTNILTLTNGINIGSVNLSDTAANSSQTVSFNTLGISFKISNATGTAITNDTVGAALASDTIIVTGSNPPITFQAGTDSANENKVSYTTVNVKTEAGSGSDAKMTDLGTQITAMVSGASGYTSSNWAEQFDLLNNNVDAALGFISDKRSSVGALANRISYISNNLEAQSTNLQSSRSAIIDTDFAAETASLTKGQIMQQAATAMLAQANQMPNVVLSLLK